MIALSDYSIWFVTLTIEIFVLALFVLRKIFREFPLFTTFLLICTTVSAGRLYCLFHFGFTSKEYAYFYYCSDGVLTGFLFLSVCEVGLRLRKDRIPRHRFIRWATGALLAAALFNYVTSDYGGYEFVRFVIRLSQSLFLVSGFFVLVLALSMLRGRNEMPVRSQPAVRFLAVIGIYFVLILIAQSVRLSPDVSTLRMLPFMASSWLPVGCGFAVLRS